MYRHDIKNISPGADIDPHKNTGNFSFHQVDDDPEFIKSDSEFDADPDRVNRRHQEVNQLDIVPTFKWKSTINLRPGVV